LETSFSFQIPAATVDGVTVWNSINSASSSMSVNVWNDYPQCVMDSSSDNSFKNRLSLKQYASLQTQVPYTELSITANNIYLRTCNWSQKGSWHNWRI